ncbi:Transcription termination factor 1 [Bagarius yarrelli]|uniref:Transcription termination factor 1 n=1 Tax=Bagarius yarrelli TaxID=175774 RepID=A0A556U816_BAGYA|nr:Transcription termination factor 1 [Bagarius yarrelli]
MGKSKEEKKWKSGVCLESAPACTVTYENLHKDKLQTSTEKDTSITDFSLESSSVKRKKKKKKEKRNRLLEQETVSACSTEHTESLRNDKEKKRKRKFIEEELRQVEDGNLRTEEPKRKKKKREKNVHVNETEETQISEPSEDVPTKKKKKKKKLKEWKENIAVKTEEVSLTIGLETQRNEKRKKKNISKDNSRDHPSTQHKQTESVSTPEEAQTSRGDKEANQDVQTREALEIDAKLLSEIKEFMPNIESKEVMSIRKIIKYDLPRFKEFKNQGISLNHGRFTAQENERLKKNVKDFMALTAIDSPIKLFFTCRFKQEQENIKKLKWLHKFFERIAEGIPRSCYYVYARGRKMFDEQNYRGEFSKEELHTLNKLHNLHGNNWKKISELTGRSAISLEKRYKQIADKEGPWSNKEVQRLLRGVRDYVVSQIPGAAESNSSLRVMKETLYKRLPWQKIAMKVKTRSWTQCREKWMYEMDVDDPACVNWEDLTALIGDVPPAYLQRKWHKLKVCNVPDWQRKCFADIVDFLYEKVLPELEKKLLSLKGLDETQHTTDDESYLFSDIFKDVNEDEDVDDDDSDNKNKESQ